MPVPEFPGRLAERSIPIEQIMLDPNNPRLATLSAEDLPEERIAEESVQAATRRRMEDGRFDVAGLRSAIRRSGLLPLDRIVVREIDGQGAVGENDRLVVVVEGNRRIAAIKGLLEQHAGGTLTVDDDAMKTIVAPSVLVLTGEESPKARLDQWVIQGVRHLTGIREWGGYQAARTIQAMTRDLGYSEADVGEALALTRQRVNRSLRVLAALEQMGEDEEYGENATPELYAHFDEMIKKPELRNWVGWDNNDREFKDEERARQFFSWISPDDELNDARRIPTSDGIRQLAPVLGSEGALAVLNTPGNTLGDALVLVAPTPTDFEWRKPLKGAIEALGKIPAATLESLEDDDRELIQKVAKTAERRLDQADKLAETSDGAVVETSAVSTAVVDAPAGAEDGLQEQAAEETPAAE